MHLIQEKRDKLEKFIFIEYWVLSRSMKLKITTTFYHWKKYLWKYYICLSRRSAFMVIGIFFSYHEVLSFELIFDQS